MTCVEDYDDEGHEVCADYSVMAACSVPHHVRLGLRRREKVMRVGPAHRLQYYLRRLAATKRNSSPLAHFVSKSPRIVCDDNHSEHAERDSTAPSDRKNDCVPVAKMPELRAVPNFAAYGIPEDDRFRIA